jgi:hypothetical protein
MRYGWNQEQLSRVNERRLARGQKPLSQTGEYSGKYSRRRKGIEEEDDETQVVSKTPRLDEYKTRQGKRVAAATPRLDEYKRRLRQREMEKSGGYLSSPYGTQTGSLA